MALGPRHAAGSCIRRARRFLELAEEQLPDSRVKNDLRRMAIVMAAAAVDTYMHASVLSAIGGVGTSITRSLGRLDVPLSELVALADSAVTARHADRDSRPRVQVKNALHRRLLRKTYQTSEQVTEALTAVGLERPWTKLETVMGQSPASLRRRLDRIVGRRNQIVHEGDLARLVRPRALKFNEVNATSVKRDVDWIDELLDAIDALLA